MKRLPILALAAFSLLLCTASVAAAASDPNEKSTVTDIQWRISYSQTVPGNCAVYGFSQWTASKFKGWDAYRLSVTYGTPPSSRTDFFSISPPPLYDDQLAYGGNIVSPPAGTHWALIGDGSWRAGPLPAEAECLAMLGRSQDAIPDHKVTTFYRRTDICATRYKALVKAEKAVKKAKSKKAKKKAKSKFSKTRKTFNKSCTR